jgi:hypothetical protein
MIGGCSMDVAPPAGAGQMLPNASFSFGKTQGCDSQGK